MKNKKIIFIGLFSFGSLAFGQVGVNNQNPQATLDVTAKTTNGSKPEGMIAPRLTGDQIKLGDAQYGANQKGALIYATAAVTSASPKTVNITAEGYYYFDGSIWQKVGSGAGSTNTDWKLTGNSGTTAGTNFIGTTDNVDFVAKTNNAEAMRVTNNQKVLIGTSTVPTGGANSKLIINNGTTNGAIQIKDGTEGDSKVLTSDSNGVGKWQSLAGSWSAYAWAAEHPTSGTMSNISFNNANTLINGQGGSFDGTNGRIYVPYDGTYRIITYVDFDQGTPEPGICNDLEVNVYNSGGSFITYNCDNVGTKDNNRKNGYMQNIFYIPAGGFVLVNTIQKATEGVVSVELIKKD